MMRSIFAAIVSALKSIVGLARRVAAAPFQALANAIGGGGGGDLPVAPEVAQYGDHEAPATGPDMDVVYRELAVALRTWAAKSIVDGQPLPLPPKLPRELAAWLPGITIDEAHAIINA